MGSYSYGADGTAVITWEGQSRTTPHRETRVTVRSVHPGGGSENHGQGGATWTTDSRRVEGTLREGDWRTRDETGRVVQMRRFLHGLQEGPTLTFAPDGGLLSQVNFSNGVPR